MPNNNQIIKPEMIMASGEVLSFATIIQIEDDALTVQTNGSKKLLETVRIGGEIQHSFYASAKAAGLSLSVMSEFANIFQWQLDFSREIHRGDRFDILLEKVSGDRLADEPRILAAWIYQQRRTLTAIRHSDGGYYTQEGKRLGRSFLRLPFEKEYSVSSGFALSRQHPIVGQIRPHKGTDWAVSVGTPVITAADGIVVESVVNHPTAGNYIEIQHGRRYVTRYLHLSQLKVKAGQQVRRGDVIGLSGNTGLSTGPHLHYEMYVDGRPVDAMKTQLRTNRILAGSELSDFKQASAKLLNRLSNKEVLANASDRQLSEASWVFFRN
nr:peptidoglycan DD-metalloendopeptidase family protein [Endozoicomonas sp.]